MKHLLTVFFVVGLLLVPLVSFGEDAAPNYEDADIFAPLSLDVGVPSPFNGILIDEETSLELMSLRASSTRLTTELEVRLNLWSEQETIYENAITSLQGRVETLLEELAGREPSWWSLYGGVVVGSIGFVLGAAVTILVAWAVAEAVDTSTL